MLNLTPISLPYTVSTDTEVPVGLSDTTFVRGRAHQLAADPQVIHPTTACGDGGTHLEN